MVKPCPGLRCGWDGRDKKNTHSTQIHSQQEPVAEEAIVQRGHITTHNQEDNARVVELVPPHGHRGRVVGQRVKGGAHAEAAESAREEAGKDEQVRARGRLVARGDQGVQQGAAQGEGHRAEQVGPDVDALVVQVPEAGQRRAEAVARLPVAAEDEGVVAPPGRELVPEQEQRRLHLGFNLLGGREERLGGRGGPALPLRAPLPECCRRVALGGAGTTRHFPVFSGD